MLRTGTTGNDVKRAVTSYDVMHSPGPRVMSLICFTKCYVFCMWCCDLPTRSLRIPAMTLGTL